MNKQKLNSKKKVIEDEVIGNKDTEDEEMYDDSLYNEEDESQGLKKSKPTEKISKVAK